MWSVVTHTTHGELKHMELHPPYSTLLPLCHSQLSHLLSPMLPTFTISKFTNILISLIRLKLNYKNNKIQTQKGITSNYLHQPRLIISYLHLCFHLKQIIFINFSVPTTLFGPFNNIIALHLHLPFF